MRSISKWNSNIHQALQGKFNWVTKLRRGRQQTRGRPPPPLLTSPSCFIKHCSSIRQFIHQLFHLQSYGRLPFSVLVKFCSKVASCERPRLLITPSFLDSQLLLLRQLPFFHPHQLTQNIFVQITKCISLKPQNVFLQVLLTDDVHFFLSFGSGFWCHCHVFKCYSCISYLGPRFQGWIFSFHHDVIFEALLNQILIWRPQFFSRIVKVVALK